MKSPFTCEQAWAIIDDDEGKPYVVWVSDLTGDQADNSPMRPMIFDNKQHADAECFKMGHDFPKARVVPINLDGIAT